MAGLVALKTLFSILTCVMAVGIVYGLIRGNLFSTCFDPHAWWMHVAVLYFLIYYSFITAWFFYKESRWILRVVLMLLQFWFGSLIPCVYIVIQLFKLSPEESLRDPLYFVLARSQKSDVMRHSKGPSVVTTRVIVVALGCLMVGITSITFIIDGSPFRAEVLSTCMRVFLIDLCSHAVIFSVWIAYKESSWIIAFIWIVLLICFGSITMCAYILRELFYLSSEQPVSLVLFSRTHRDLMVSVPMLMEHSNA